MFAKVLLYFLKGKVKWESKENGNSMAANSKSTFHIFRPPPLYMNSQHCRIFNQIQTFLVIAAQVATLPSYATCAESF